jgi:hypothetical protein
MGGKKKQFLLSKFQTLYNDLDVLLKESRPSVPKIARVLRQTRREEFNDVCQQGILSYLTLF